MRRLRVVFIVWDEHTVVKIAKHGLQTWEVEDAVIHSPDKAAWKDDHIHGRRLMVLGTCEQNKKRIVAFLRPLNEADGIWTIITA